MEVPNLLMLLFVCFLNYFSLWKHPNHIYNINLENSQVKTNHSYLDYPNCLYLMFSSPKLEASFYSNYRAQTVES